MPCGKCRSQDNGHAALGQSGPTLTFVPATLNQQKGQQVSIRSPRRLTACLQALSMGPSTLSPAGDTVAERMKQRQSSSKNPAALIIIQRRLDEIKKKNKPVALSSPFSTPKGKRMATAVVSDADGVHQDEPVAKRKLFNKDAACSSASRYFA